MSKELIERLRGLDSVQIWTKEERHELVDLIEQLQRENACQLAELHSIANALGTDEGHSSVHWVTELTNQRDELLAALERMEFAFAPLAKDSTLANLIDEARAAIANVKGGAA